MKIKGFILYHSPTGKICKNKNWKWTDDFVVDGFPHIWETQKMASSTIHRAMVFSEHFDPSYKTALKEFVMGLEVREAEIIIKNTGIPSGLFSVASIHRPVRIK
jgi:hypothetical protein